METDGIIATQAAMEPVALDYDWQPWLDTAGQDALAHGLYTCGWAYQMTQDGHDWFCLNHTGRVMLGLAEPPRVHRNPRICRFCLICPFWPESTSLRKH